MPDFDPDLYAINALTRSGVMGDGAFGIVRMALNPRKFTPEEESSVTSHIRLDLPFAMHGMICSAQYQDFSMNMSVCERPKEIAGYNIGLSEMGPGVKHVRLEPDPWGHVNYNVVRLSINGLRPTEPNTDEDPNSFYTGVLRTVTPIINEYVDWYCLASKTYSCAHVSPQSFVKMELWHSLEGESKTCNHTFVHFPNAKFSFRPPDTEGNDVLLDKIKRYQKLDSAYSLACRLFAGAMRELADFAYALAAIQGINTLEMALGHYIKTWLECTKDQSAVQRIPLKTYGDLEREIGVAMELKILFPLLLPPSIPYPKDDVDACNELRKARNDAIHDPVKFEEKLRKQDPKINSQTIATGVIAVGKILKFLINNHPVSPLVEVAKGK
jgi:hypothetical protein